MNRISLFRKSVIAVVVLLATLGFTVQALAQQATPLSDTSSNQTIASEEHVSTDEILTRTYSITNDSINRQTNILGVIGTFLIGFSEEKNNREGDAKAHNNGRGSRWNFKKIAKQAQS